MIGFDRLKDYIKREKVDGILISSVPNIAYLTGFHRFEKSERDAYILLTKTACYLITNALYAQAFKAKKWDITLIEVSSGLPVKKVFTQIRDKEKINCLVVEEYDLRVSEYKFFRKIFKKIKKFNFPGFRSIKDKYEIRYLEKACQIGDAAFEYILKKIRISVSEKELANELKVSVLGHGYEMSFPTIVAFGKNGATPHHQTGETKLKSGQLILMDYGVEVEGYCSDMTRVIVFGKATSEQRKIYQAVLESQQKAVELIKSHLKAGKEIKAAEVDRIARKHLTEGGFPDISHSLGHGVGLEVHEHPHLSPKSQDILKPGMVFSIEPGIYLPKVEGVRIEDLYTISGKKLIQLTKSPKHLIEL